jgi:hypothetical protein
MFNNQFSKKQNTIPASISASPLSFGDEVGAGGEVKIFKLINHATKKSLIGSHSACRKYYDFER